MTTKPKKTYRKRYLFPRTLEEVVQKATQPLMDKQGKLYSALLRDWEKIVGPERAAVTRPERLQFTAAEGSSATLHLAIRPAAAPEFAYVQEQVVEQCARYFGYRAVTRIVLHPTHHAFDEKEQPSTPQPADSTQIKNTPLLQAAPSEMQDVLARIGQHVASSVVKKN